MADSEEVTTQHSTVEDWTRALAESIGSPGGGAGAGVMLAVAASLTSMVAGYTDPDDDQQDHLENLLARAHNLRRQALRLADEDAAASSAFGAAFRLERGKERNEAIREASLGAARSSATLGEHAIGAIDDLAWLAQHGNRALIADVVVAFGALRAAVTGARTNVSFDLASMKSTGLTLETVREQNPQVWATVGALNAAIERIDAVLAAVDHRAAPTDAV